MGTNDSARQKPLTAGMAIRQEVLGHDYVATAMGHDDKISQEFQQFMTEYCWGQVWTDDRLSRRDHSLLVLAITATLGKMTEFEAHVHGAIRNGVSESELASMLRQIMVYAGVPAGVSASRAIRNALKVHSGQ